MKRLTILIGLILIYFNSFAQFPLNPTSGVNNINQNWLGAYTFQRGMVAGTYADTTAANLIPYMKGVAFIMISTTNDNAIWFRNAAATKWIQLLPSGSPTGLGAWTTTLNTTIPTDISLNGYFGTTASNGIGFYTSNAQRVILPASGLSLKSVVGDTTLNKPMVWNTSTKEWNYAYWFSGGSSTTPTWQQTLTAGSTLNTDNTIDNGANTFTFTNNSLAGDYGFVISSNSTAATASGQALTGILLSGANANSGQTTTSLIVSNTHTGTSSTNVGVNIVAQGANNNYALIIQPGGGNVGIGTTAPTQLLSLGTAGSTSGIFNIAGSTSGTITFQPQAAAGTYNWNWPTTAGTSGYLLTSGGGGSSAMTWTAPGANTALSNLASVAINTSLLPGTDDGAALGSTSKEFSDLFLASGGVINWANGNTTLTQTSGALTLGGGFYATSSVAAGTYLYGGDKYNTYTGYTGAVLGGITTHAVLDFVDNNSRIGEFYTDASNFNFFTDVSKGIVFYVNNSFTAPALQFSSAGALRLGYLGAGALTADASGNITSVSDERLKNIEGGYGVGLSQVYKINPIVYKWKPETKLDSLNSYIGFSAQNIEYALGENAVGINRDGYKSIQDRAILAALTNSIKELKDLNDSQQKEIDDLKKEVKKLKRL